MALEPIIRAGSPTLGDIRESPLRAQRFEEAARAQRDLFLKKLEDTEKQRTVSLKEALTQLSNEYARYIHACEHFAHST